MTQKHDYTALDAHILERITEGEHTIGGLMAGKVLAEAQALEAENKAMLTGPYRVGRPAFRFVDSRLQALRKANKITHCKSAGWIIKPKITI